MNLTMKLGKIQKHVLQGLADHGEWDERSCSWVWDNHSHTKRVLDSLVKKGLVTVVSTPLWEGSSRTTGLYTLANRA